MSRLINVGRNRFLSVSITKQWNLKPKIFTDFCNRNIETTVFKISFLKIEIEYEFYDRINNYHG